MISDENDINIKEWNQYNILVITPSIVAGLSFNIKHFDNIICYSNNSGCSAKILSQMIHRVRNVSCDNIVVYFNKMHLDINCPTSFKKIVGQMHCKDNLVENCGLKINVALKKIVQDDYFYNYVNYKKSENLSKIMFVACLKGILNAHGYRQRNELSEKYKWTELSGEIYTEMNKKIREKMKAKREEENFVIAGAKYKEGLPPDKKNNIYAWEKYELINTFEISEENLCPKFVKKFGNA